MSKSAGNNSASASPPKVKKKKIINSYFQVQECRRGHGVIHQSSCATGAAAGHIVRKKTPEITSGTAGPAADLHLSTHTCGAAAAQNESTASL